ncbi:PaaI family thioesterase [Oceanidesulfovibrio marinus]|uniref:PaaI family thioesterase n=2 Tax=Oceanidesulfovibrio marinus TaxID=370038 RepID=A0ABX6NEY3_9BACT|nr:PaaI family thioesterase [Oceanidesulfovibrio marinus]
MLPPYQEDITMRDDLEAFARANAFAQLCGIEVVEARPGHAVTRMTLEDRHRNPFGTASAGAVFMLAETAFGMAINAELAPGGQGVAVNLAISYLRPGVEGVLTATARRSASGGPLASYEVEVRNEEGEVIAHAQAMGFCKRPKS